jgi:hypothetical protein
MKETPCISSFSIDQSEALHGKTAFSQKTQEEKIDHSSRSDKSILQGVG